MDGCHRRRGIGYGIITVDIMNILTIGPTTTDLQVVSSYVEDDRELNVLVSTMVSPEQQMRVLNTPNTRRPTSRSRCSGSSQRSAHEETNKRVEGKHPHA